MAMGAAFMCILELEKEVLRLWYHVSVLSKRLTGGKKEDKTEEKVQMAVQNEVEAKVAAIAAPPIVSGVYKAMAKEVVDEESDSVAEEVVAVIETMSVGTKEGED